MANLPNSPAIDENGVMSLKLNEFQSLVHTSLFNGDGTLRDDAPMETGEWGGFGNGKSMYVNLCVFLVCSTYPNVRWLSARATGPQLEDSVIPQFRDLFPEDQCGYRYLVQKKEARFFNGSVIFFRAFDGPRVKRILSTNYDGASICQAEEVSEELALQIFGRLRGNSLPKNLFITEGNPDDTWPKVRYKSNEYQPIESECLKCGDATTHILRRSKMTYNPDIITDAYMLVGDCEECGTTKNIRLYVEGKTDANKANLPPGYISRMRNEFPADWVERYLESNWDKTSNMVHPEFKERIHVVNPRPIEDHWEKIIGMDHGTVNPSAMLWAAIDERGDLYIYDEFYKAQQRVDELVQANQKHGNISTVADYSMKVKDKNFESLWDDLEKAGLNLIECHKDKTANILLVNQLFHNRRIFIFNTCENLIKELKNYRWAKPKLGEDKNRKEEVIKKDDHACDALQYLVRYLHDIKVLEPVPYPKEMTLAHHVMSYDYNEMDEG